MTTQAPALGPVAMARWAWRQLTSMRTALILLLVLAVVAIPGSIVPQRGVDQRAVERFFLDHPSLAPVLDSLGLFSMYTSVWFGSVYVLLMVSLIGCIVPRTLTYARQLRRRPPSAPRHLDRLGAYARFETRAEPARVLAEGRRLLRGARVDVVDDELRAERGYLRELGNLVFHIAIVVVLVGMAAGALLGYRGTIMVVEGDSFANNLTQYDEFAAGALFDERDMPPFALDLDRVTAEFRLEGAQRGAPSLFRAEGSYATRPGAEARPAVIEVNRPLTVEGTQLSLLGTGYAPVIRVTDAEGDIVFDGPVPFLPEDASYISSGVVKIPEAKPEQLGLQGFFLPTAVAPADGGPSFSAFPAPANPYLGLFAFHGDLGLDDGSPQSVYVLEKEGLTQFVDDDGENLRIDIQPGQSAELPDGSVVEFVDLRMYGRFAVGSTPYMWLSLWGIVAGTLGLMLSLYVRPRRWWIRLAPGAAGTVVEVAAIDRIARGGLDEHLESLAGRLAEAVGSEQRGEA